MNLKKIILLLTLSFVGLAILFGGYSSWNSANPEKTCASCHEISPSVNEWQHSAHRDVRCTECHGSALSNGVHSLKEKANMVFTHLGKEMTHDDIHLTEKQVLEISDKCAKCHQSEYAKWKSSGHSANYADIFMNGKHNMEEAPYWDCLRCHGMFYDGNIKTLLKKPQEADGVWKLNDMSKVAEPTIPCLACHQFHTENTTLARATRLDNPQQISYERPKRNVPIAWYVRTDHRHIRADKLMNINLDVNSPNNIHSVSCTSCHEQKEKRKS